MWVLACLVLMQPKAISRCAELFTIARSRVQHLHGFPADGTNRHTVLFATRLSMLPAGSIPISWAAKGVFPSLSTLHIENVPMTGSLPQVWGNEACPGLIDLELTNLSISGTLPAEWGSPSSFQQL